MFFTSAPAGTNITVITDCRGFLQPAPYTVRAFPSGPSCLLMPPPPYPDYEKSVFIICQDWYVNPFAPDPSLEMLWVLLEEWLLSYLGGLSTSTLRIPSGKDWIWYAGLYLGSRSLSSFYVFLLFRCTSCFSKCFCVLLIQILYNSICLPLRLSMAR